MQFDAQENSSSAQALNMSIVHWRFSGRKWAPGLRIPFLCNLVSSVNRLCAVRYNEEPTHEHSLRESEIQADE